MTERNHDEEARLDALLADWTTPGASRGLHERVVASARTSQARTSKDRAARGVWWAGAAGLGIAGAVAGALLAAVLAPAQPPPPMNGEAFYASGATVFGDLDDGSES